MTDRELDCLVAEKVMGHKVCDRNTAVALTDAAALERHKKTNDYHDRHGLPRLPFQSFQGWYAGDLYLSDSLSNFGMAELPAYSTEMNDALQVVEHLKQRTFRLEFGINHRSGWTVCIDGSVMAQFIDTPQRAICLAALNWTKKTDTWRERHAGLDLAAEGTQDYSPTTQTWHDRPPLL